MGKTRVRIVLMGAASVELVAVNVMGKIGLGRFDIRKIRVAMLVLLLEQRLSRRSAIAKRSHEIDHDCRSCSHRWLDRCDSVEKDGEETERGYRDGFEGSDCAMWVLLPENALGTGGDETNNRRRGERHERSSCRVRSRRRGCRTGAQRMGWAIDRIQNKINQMQQSHAPHLDPPVDPRPKQLTACTCRAVAASVVHGLVGRWVRYHFSTVTGA